MMTGRPKKVEPAQFHMAGDKVLWKGILLTVLRVRDDGYIECWSPTMHLTVDSHEQLEKAAK
jgi:hypothetical protein